jgi:hypothetical protein
MSLTKLPYGIAAFPLVGSNLLDMFTGTYNNLWFVDGDKGSDGFDGRSPESAKATIQAAVTAAAALNLITKSGSTIYIKAKYMVAGSSDPSSYAEAITIPAAGGERTALIGVSENRTQMGLPQIKVGGAAHTYAIDIKASGCIIANLGINGNSAAGAPINGGILLDSDGATGTYRADGTTIINCHFKNCAGTTITDCRTGGAIDWTANGDCWQVRIIGNRFYKNACDVCLLGTSNSVPQDVVIEDNIFSGPTASVDTNLYLAGGSGMVSVHIRNNVFPAIGTLGSAVVKRFISATGCVGVMEGNSFGTSTTLTFGAAGTACLIPTTMFMPRNYRETTTGVSSEVFRT